MRFPQINLGHFVLKFFVSPKHIIPQINLGHFVLKFFVSPKYSGPRIIADMPTQID